jgi:hypothetical protein
MRWIDLPRLGRARELLERQWSNAEQSIRSIRIGAHISMQMDKNDPLSLEN